MTEAAGPGGAADRVAVDRDAPASAPGERGAPHLALLLGGGAAVQGQPGARMVSGDSPTARQHGLGDGQSVALELELAVPAADQMAEPVVGQRGCGPGGRVQPVDGDRVRRTVRGPRVGQFRPAFDDVRAGPDAVAEFGPQGAVPVIEEQPEFPAVDAVAGEAPLGAAGSVGEADLESGRSEARSGLRREFVGGGVGLEAALGGETTSGSAARVKVSSGAPQYRCRGLPSAPSRSAYRLFGVRRTARPRAGSKVTGGSAASTDGSPDVR